MRTGRRRTRARPRAGPLPRTLLDRLFCGLLFAGMAGVAGHLVVHAVLLELGVDRARHLHHLARDHLLLGVLVEGLGVVAAVALLADGLRHLLHLLLERVLVDVL